MMHPSTPPLSAADAKLFEAWGLRTGPIPTKEEFLSGLSDMFDAYALEHPPAQLQRETLQVKYLQEHLNFRSKTNVH